MVHALQRARRHLRPDGVLVLIQPHQHKRPVIALTTSRATEPVSALINPAFQPLIDNAMAAIQRVVELRLFEPDRTSNHRFRLRLESPSELQRYLHLGQRPPRFPHGGRKRLRELWRARRPGAQIEVTEFFRVTVLRPKSS